jgi:hypothetical protein
MDKKLNIFEFRELLEREIMQFAICSIIFEDKFATKYLTKIKEHKEKLQNIADKLGDDPFYVADCMIETVYKKVFPTEGVPVFKYRTEKAKEAFDIVVKSNLFRELDAVEVESVGGKILVFDFVRNNPNEETITVHRSQEIIDVNYKDVRNIFDKEEIFTLIR